MAISIMELRPDGVVAAVQFAGECKCDTSAGKIVPALSLLVLDGDDATVAAALCYAQKGKRHRIEVGLKDPEDMRLHRTLVDKAIMKLTAGGVRKFDIRTNGAVDHQDFWHAVSWIDQTLAEPSPAASEVAEPVGMRSPASWHTWRLCHACANGSA